MIFLTKHLHKMGSHDENTPWSKISPEFIICFWKLVCSRCIFGRFTFERIHNTKEQIYFYEKAENHKAKERMFK